MFENNLQFNNWFVENINWILIPLELLFGLSMATFSFIFFYHRWLLNLEYKIKNKFNELQLTTNANSFRYLESLAKNNEQLHILLENANKSKNFFIAQLNTVKDKIINLTETNEKYKFKISKKLVMEIEKDLQMCDEMSQRLRYISSNSTEYSKNVSDLLTQYWNIVEDTENFYRINLSTKYKNQIFKNMIQKISEHLSDAKEYVLKIDNNGLINSLNGLNEHVWNFFDVVIQLYVLNRLSIYIKMLLEQVQMGIKKNEKSLSSTEVVDIQKKSSLAANNLDELVRNLQSIDLKHAWGAATVSIRNLENSKVRVEQGSELNDIIKKSGNVLHETITTLVENIKIIQESFISISNIFGKKDPWTSQRISDLSHMLKTITWSYQIIINDMKSYETIERQAIVTKIKNVIDEIKKWKDSASELIKAAVEKSNESLSIINEIAELKLNFNQILGIKADLGTDDEITKKTIEKNLEIISQNEEKLNNDYFANKEQVLVELRKLKDQSFTLMETTFFDDSLRLYCQRLIMFLNKYRNEANEIERNINLSEKYFAEKKYEESLGILLETANAIKSSAKQNKMSLI